MGTARGVLVVPFPLQISVLNRLVLETCDKMREQSGNCDRECDGGQREKALNGVSTGETNY